MCSQILHSFIDLGFRPGYIIYEDLHERAFELPDVTEKYMNENGYRLMSRRGWNLIYCQNRKWPKVSWYSCHKVTFMTCFCHKTKTLTCARYVTLFDINFIFNQMKIYDTICLDIYVTVTFMSYFASRPGNWCMHSCSHQAAKVGYDIVW